MRKNCFSKKKMSTPPPRKFCNFFYTKLLLKKVGNSIKREEKFHQYQKLYSTPP